MQTATYGLEPFRRALSPPPRRYDCADLANMPLAALLYFALTTNKNSEKPRD